MTVDVSKVFALVDRKVSNFKFTLEKVTGNAVGNEYYVINVSCVAGNGREFTKKAIVTGCPAAKVEEISNELVKFLRDNGIRLTRTRTPVRLTESRPFRASSGAPAQGITRVVPGMRTQQTFTSAPVVTGRYCPQCGNKLGVGFVYCNSCGKKQP